MTQALFTRARVWTALTIAVVGLVGAVACGSGNHSSGVPAPGCIDNDQDGYGDGCWSGPDCDDNDPKVTSCGGQASCEVNPFGTGCLCETEGELHDCGKVTKRSKNFLACGYGSVTCSGGAWSDCRLDPKQSGFLTYGSKKYQSYQQLLSLGTATPCTSNPCDPNCMQFTDIPDQSIFTADAGASDGGLLINDGGLSLSVYDAAVAPPAPAVPDAGTVPPPPPGPADLSISKTVCTPVTTAEGGATLSCQVTIVNGGGTYAGAFDNEIYLSSDTTITNGDTRLGDCSVSSLANGATVVVTCSGTIPSTTTGSWNAGIITDSGNTVSESDETNNTSSVAVTIVPPSPPPPPPPPPLADLKVTLMTCTDPVEIGGTVSCTVNVTNTGGTYAPAFDNQIWVASVELGTCAVSGIDPAGTASMTCSGTVPPSAAPGPWNAVIMVDSGDTVPESDEANNQGVEPFTVTAAQTPPPPPALADLTISNVACKPSVEQGSPLSCNIQITNAGGTWAPGFSVELHLSVDGIAETDPPDPLLAICTSTGIAASGSSTIDCSGTVPASTAPGSWNVGIIVDPGNAVPESNEANNSDASVATTVTAVPLVPPPLPPPDLALTAFSCTPVSLEAGATLSCDVTVQNLGGTFAPGFAGAIWLSTDTVPGNGGDLQLADCDFPGLDAAGTSMVTCSGAIPVGTATGTYNAIGVVDSGGVILESNETNNQGSQSVSVTATTIPTPPAANGDLVFDAATTCDTLVDAGGTILCTMAIKNQGGTWATSFTNEIWLSTDATLDGGDTKLGSCTVATLANSASTVLECTGVVPVGTAASPWKAILVTDGTKVVPETNEANNQFVASFNVVTPVPPPPPATPADILIAPTGVSCSASVVQGSTLSCSVSLQNPGGSWTGPFAVDLRLGPTTIGTCDVSTLASGGAQPLTCSATLPAATPVGTATISVVADPGAAVAESDETNNTGSANITVAAPPTPPAPPTPADLVVSAISCSTTTEVGSPVSCNVTVNNQGGTYAPAESVALYRSTDNTITTGDTLLSTCTIGGLAAGGSETLICAGTMPTATPLGPYYLGVIVDSTNAVAESIETNNTKANPTPTTVTAAPAPPTLPDLTSAVTCLATVQAGSPLTCSVTISNGGGSWAQASTAAFTLSGVITLANCGVTGITAGGATTFDCSGVVPLATSPGNYLSEIMADSGAVVAESAEGNNTSISSFVNVTAPPPPATVDLTVSAISCAPATVSPGEVVTCSVTVNNAEGAYASAFANQLILSSDATIASPPDVVLSTCTSNGLAGLASQTITCSGTIPTSQAVGAYRVGAMADSGAVIAESNEGNNTGTPVSVTAPLSITATPPDLVVSAIACTDAVSVGSPMSCTYTIQNLGGSSTGAAPTTQLELSADSSITTGDTTLATCPAIGVLAAGASAVQTCTGTVPATTATGTQYAGIITDTTGAVTESNEGNNTSSDVFVAVAVGEPADTLSPGTQGPTHSVDPTLNSKVNSIQVFWLVDIAGNNFYSLRNLYNAMTTTQTSIQGTYPSATFGVGHFSSFKKFPWGMQGGQSCSNAQQNSIFYTQTANAGLGAPLVHITNNVTAVTNGILAWDTSPTTCVFGCGGADCRTLSATFDDPQPWGLAAFAELYDTGASPTLSEAIWGGTSAAAGNDSTLTVPAKSCPSGGIGQPCFTSGGVPITVIFTANSTHQGPGGFFAMNHPMTDSGWSRTYQTTSGGNCTSTNCDPIPGADTWPVASAGGGATEAAATPIDPTTFQRYTNTFPSGGTDVAIQTQSGAPFTTALNGWATSTRNFPTVYSNWWGGVTPGDARGLCMDGQNADGRSRTPFFFKFSLSDRTFVHFDNYGTKNTIDTVMYVIDRTAAHTDTEDQVVTCADWNWPIYFDGSPRNGYVSKTQTSSGNNWADSTTKDAPSKVAALDAYLDAGDYVLVVARRGSTYGKFFLNVNAMPDTGADSHVTLPTFDQMIAHHTAIGAKIIGVDTSGMGPINDTGTDFNTCTSFGEVGHRMDRWTSVTLQEAARETGAVDPNNANFWTNPYVFSVNAHGDPCNSGDPALSTSLTNTILGLSNNARQDIYFHSYDTDDVTDYDSASPVNPPTILTSPNLDESSSAAYPLGYFVASATPTGDTARCASVADGVGTDCMADTNLNFDVKLGVPLGFPQLCNAQIFRFEIRAETATGFVLSDPAQYATVVVPGNSALCATSVADLTATIGSCTTPVTQGQTLSCNVTFTNNGTSAASAFTNSLNLVNAGDTLIGTCGVPSLAAGASSTVTCTGSVPAAQPTGTYPAKIIADSGGAVTESNEGNNTASTNITVTSAPTPPSPADILVTNVNCPVSTIAAGGTLSCAVTLKNFGGTYVGPFVTSLVLSSNTSIATPPDVLLGTCAVGALAGGQSTAITCSGIVPVATPVGAYYAGAIADSAGVIAESNELNNTGYFAANVSVFAQPAEPKPDLAVTSVTCSSPVEQGGTVSCTFQLKNQGSVYAAASVNSLRLSPDAAITAADVSLGNCDVSAIDLNAAITITCSGTVPVGQPPGNYYAGIIADSTSVVAESNEGNNTGATATANVAVTTAPTAPPPATAADLVATMTCPASVDQGQTFACSVTFNNLGQTYAGAFTTDVRLSADSVIDGADTLIGSCIVPELGAGASQIATCTGTIPSATAAGAWRVGLIADSGLAIPESNEANNTTSEPVTVTVPSTPPPPAQPDLVVTSVVCPSTTGVQGDTLACTITLANNGGSAAGTFTTRLVLSSDTAITTGDTTIADCGTGTLGATDTVSLTCAGTIPAAQGLGAWYPGAIVDVTSAVAEQSETNNTAYQAALTVTAAPIPPPPVAPTDLVASVASLPGPVDQGGTLVFNFTVNNAGGVDAGAFTNALWLSSDATLDAGDTQLGSCGVSYLAGGGSVNVTCTGTVPAATPTGAWTAILAVDSGGVILETSEANNTASAPVTIAPPPSPPVVAPADLQVTAVDCSASVAQGAMLACDVTVANVGGTFAGAFTSELHLSSDTAITAADPLLGSCGIGALPAGATTTVTCSGSVPLPTATGAWFGGIIADSGAVIPEGDETNNSGSDPLTVTAAPTAPPPATPPDLVVTSVNCPASVAQGDTLACSVAVLNNGQTFATAFSVALYLSNDATITTGDALLGTCGVSALVAAGTATITCSGTVPAATALGAWFGGAITDSSNVIAEGSEANNTGSDSLNVVAPPPPPPGTTPADLHVESMSCTPTSVEQGGTLECDVTVENLGGTGATVFDNTLRLSVDSTIDATDTLLGDCGLSNLGAGLTATVTCAGSIASGTATGTWYAGMTVDATGVIPESDETNNTSSATFTVAAAPTIPAPTPADLAPVSVTCPSPFNPGDPMSCDVVVGNYGGSDAVASTVELRLSNDTTIDGTDTLVATCSAPAIVAGGTATVTCAGATPATLPAGVYLYVGAIVDSANVVSESNETNNTRYTTSLVALPPPIFTDGYYARDYEGATLCSAQDNPVWGMFSWQAQTPGDSHIAFTVQTATTRAGLDGAPVVPLAVAARDQAATPPGYGGTLYPPGGNTDTQLASVAVTDALSGTGQALYDGWLRVTIHLVASSDQLDPPNLGVWGLQVSCTPSR